MPMIRSITNNSADGGTKAGLTVSFHNKVVVYEMSQLEGIANVNITSIGLNKDDGQTHSIPFNTFSSAAVQTRRNVKKLLKKKKEHGCEVKLVRAAWNEYIIRRPEELHVRFTSGSGPVYTIQDTRAILYTMKPAPEVSMRSLATSTTSAVTTAPNETVCRQRVIGASSQSFVLDYARRFGRSIMSGYRHLQFCPEHVTTADAAAHEIYLSKYHCPCCTPPITMVKNPMSAGWSVRIGGLSKPGFVERRSLGVSVERDPRGNVIRIVGLTKAGERFEIN